MAWTHHIVNYPVEEGESKLLLFLNCDSESAESLNVNNYDWLETFLCSADAVDGTLVQDSSEFAYVERERFLSPFMVLHY